MSTHRGELDKLIAGMEARGSEVTVKYCDNGYIDTIAYDGSRPMNPLVFAEQVRPILRLRGAR